MEVMKQVGLTQEIFAGINQNLQDGWADIFCGHSWVAWECLRLKNKFFSNLYIFFNIFFRGQHRAFQLVLYIYLY